MQPKYQVNQSIKMGKSPTYIIKEIATHGNGNCDCCPVATTYYMYRITNNVWVNENTIDIPIKN